MFQKIQNLISTHAITPKKVAVILLPILAIISVHVLTLFLLGQPWICECAGTSGALIKIWEGDILSSGMSQHLFDWYTFSHIIHGFVFYAVLTYFFPKMSLFTKLLWSMGIEVAWEIAENTPYVINAYREQALAQGYVGDSIINSFMDLLSMIFGFFFALRMPVWVTVFIAILFEVGVGISIRDNLTLNVLNFIYQFDFIKEWQSGMLK